MTEREAPELPYVSGYMAYDSESGARENMEWYRGHIPKVAFPDHVTVVYTKCPYTGDQMTRISWCSVPPTAIIEVHDGREDA
jgi:hypothetical protein